MGKRASIWRMILMSLLGAAALMGCAGGPEVTSSKSVPTHGLEAVETGGWPEFLRRLDLPEARDYMVLAYVPPANAIDLSSAEAARGTMARMVFDQLGAMEAGTTIGHLIVGWQCGGVQGMTSMSGEQDLQGQKMYLTGWGMTPILSTFLDGEIVPLARFPEDQHRALLEGRGVVVAAQVGRRDCEAARAEVLRFARHPAQPHQNYSLLLRPELNEGGGCLSFALNVARKAGMMTRLAGLARRDVDVRAVQLGGGGTPPSDVVAYQAPNDHHPEDPVGWLDVLTRDWSDGPVIDTVTLPDGEAIMAAMVYARVGTGPKNDWRYSRTMSRSDPVIRSAADYGYQWAKSYPIRRIADQNGVSALVLERR